VTVADLSWTRIAADLHGSRVASAVRPGAPEWVIGVHL
jgi:hypothetical protein